MRLPHACQMNPRLYLASLARIRMALGIHFETVEPAKRGLVCIQASRSESFLSRRQYLTRDRGIRRLSEEMRERVEHHRVHFELNGDAVHCLDSTSRDRVWRRFIGLFTLREDDERFVNANGQWLNVRYR